jgi:flagellin
MALSILNNISALTAQNQLSITQTNLQKTLTQLSSGSRITSGADDAAGLSIANGMQANIAALTQSGQNATNAIGVFQTADGALSQVTSLLNRAVTLATEASSQGLSSTQTTALQTEFASILSNINNIGTQTNFNGKSVFGATVTPFLSDGTVGNNLLNGTSMSIGALSATNLNISQAASNTFNLSAQASNGDNITIGGETYTFQSTLTAGTATGVHVQLGGTAQQTLQNLYNAINAGSGSGSAYSSGATATANATVTATSLGSGSIVLQALTGGSGGNSTVSTIGTCANGSFTNGATFTGGAGAAADLNTTADATTALNQVTSALNLVAQMRGNMGAYINQLTAASNIMSTQVQNLTSAASGITDADVAKTVADMTKYNVLESTGMAALQQANQASQTVLKLLQ